MAKRIKIISNEPDPKTGQPQVISVWSVDARKACQGGAWRPFTERDTALLAQRATPPTPEQLHVDRASRTEDEVLDPRQAPADGNEKPSRGSRGGKRAANDD